MTSPVRSTNYFALFGLPNAFLLDLKTLEMTHRELAKASHPDRYTAALPEERRRALTQAMAISEAYRALRNPITRAETLFREAGVAVGETLEPKADPAFLMEVMEEREALSDARSAKDVATVRRELARAEAKKAALEGELAQVLVPGASYNSVQNALPLLGKLRYCQRFIEEAEGLLEELEGL